MVAKEFARAMKDMTGDKTKGETFYDGLWKIHNHSQDLKCDSGTLALINVCCNCNLHLVIIPPTS